MQQSLLIGVTTEEIFSILKCMPRNKSPRPNGYTMEFFLASWDVISALFIAIVKEFFRSGRLLRHANATAIALVPTVPQPSLKTDYRHIACCNIVYKTG